MVCGCYYSVRGFHRGTHVLLWCVWDFLNFALMALGVKPKASCMLGKPCNTEVCFFPLNFFLKLISRLSRLALNSHCSTVAGIAVQHVVHLGWEYKVQITV